MWSTNFEPPNLQHSAERFIWGKGNTTFNLSEAKSTIWNFLKYFEEIEKGPYANGYASMQNTEFYFAILAIST